MTLPPPVTPVPGPAEQRGRKTTGIVVAAISHVAGSGLLLYTMFTFTFFATPDTPAMALCLALILHVVFFVIGYLLRRGSDQAFGQGLLIGWGAGFAALLLGAAAIVLLAAVLL